MYKLMRLPFSYNALEPDISALTVDIHYNKHHKKYNDNLNKLVQNDLYPLDLLPQNIDKFPIEMRAEILFNAGGVLNHNLYWNSLGKNKSMPTGKLLLKINQFYGNFDNFKSIFTEKAKKMVGSGYTFLVASKGDLTIMNLPNQETPFSYGFVPLFTIDLWEHAYYLDYKNNRDLYIENFWNKANFDYASKTYENIE